VKATQGLTKALINVKSTASEASRKKIESDVQKLRQSVQAEEEKVETHEKSLNALLDTTEDEHDFMEKKMEDTEGHMNELDANIKDVKEKIS